jgi:hypothetical protein
MEIWKDVVGYEGYYQVSNLGRVKSLDRVVTDKMGVKRNHKGFVKKLTHGNHGYMTVGLCRNGKNTQCLVHRLVAEAFIPNKEKLPFINHKDEVRDNNHVENLEWCTQEYNNRYGTAPDRVKNKIRELGQMKAVVQLTLSGEKINEYESLHEASRKTGVGLPNIWKAVNGGYNKHGKWRRAHTAGGYKWRWAK